MYSNTLTKSCVTAVAGCQPRHRTQLTAHWLSLPRLQFAGVTQLQNFRVLVTGAGGYVGSRVIAALLENGAAAVIAVDVAFAVPAPVHSAVRRLGV